MIYNIGAGESQITICEDGRQYRLFVPGERGFFVSMPYLLAIWLIPLKTLKNLGRNQKYYYKYNKLGAKLKHINNMNKKTEKYSKKYSKKLEK